MTFAQLGQNLQNVFQGRAARQDEGRHLIVSTVEHPAVLEVVRALERQGRIGLTVVGPEAHLVAGLVDARGQGAGDGNLAGGQDLVVDGGITIVC